MNEPQQISQKALTSYHFLVTRIKAISQTLKLDPPPTLIIRGKGITAYADIDQNSISISPLLLEMYGDKALGVVAHEISHIKLANLSRNRLLFWAYSNGRIVIILSVILGLLGFLILPLFTALLVSLSLINTPQLIYCYLSRKEEALADRMAAEVVGRETMIRALDALKENGRSDKWWMRYPAEIIEKTVILSTHPSYAKRIETVNPFFS